MLRDIPPTTSRRRLNRENYNYLVGGHVNAAFDSTDFEVAMNANAVDGDVVSHIRPFSRSVAKAMIR